MLSVNDTGAWVKDDKAIFVAASRHEGYDIKKASDVQWEGTHPKVVYHKDGGSTHSFRFATKGDEPPENHYKNWRRSTLVSYNGFPKENGVNVIRDKLVGWNFGSGTIAFKDSQFGGNLQSAHPEGQFEEWDNNLDEDGSPGDPNPQPYPPVGFPPKPKIMIVGDSISRGREGDFTWRFRLWEWFNNQDIPVDFVGPYSGTLPPDVAKLPDPPQVDGEPDPPRPEPRTYSRYAAGISFDSDHFSVWGRQAAQDKNQINFQITQHKPDYILVELGFNDLGWWVSGPEGTLQSIKTLVDNARKAKSNIKILIGNVPQRTAIGGRDDLPIITNDYNAMLKKAIPGWSTSESQIELVELRENYACETSGCPGSYDSLHPNARGEYQIAQAYTKTLFNKFKIGCGPLPIPPNILERNTPVPTNFKAEAVPSGIKITWDAPYGALGYDFRSRIKGQTDWTTFPAGESHLGTNRADTTWLSDGQTWEYQVRTSNGDSLKSAWTGIITCIAHPKTPPPPGYINTRSTATGVDITWGVPIGGAERYAVITHDKDVPGAYISVKGTKDQLIHIDGLNAGHRYLVAIQGWNANGGGLPGVGRGIIVGGGKPAAPTNLKVVSTDGVTVQMTWSASANAAGYRPWTRNINDGSVSTADSTTFIEETSYGITYLFPGTWNFEFCVSAFNGGLDSGKSNCVVPARAPVW